METLVKKQNHLKSFLSKKGIVSFVFSKLAFLIFGIIIAATFFYVISIQHNIQDIDELARTSDSIANVINMISASKFKVWTIYESDSNYNISFENQSFTIFNGKELKRGLLFPINATDSDSNIPISCLNISNTNGVVIKKCQ